MNLRQFEFYILWNHLSEAYVNIYSKNFKYQKVNINFNFLPFEAGNIRKFSKLYLSFSAYFLCNVLMNVFLQVLFRDKARYFFVYSENYLSFKIFRKFKILRRGNFYFVYYAITLCSCDHFATINSTTLLSIFACSAFSDE